MPVAAAILPRRTGFGTISRHVACFWKTQAAQRAGSESRSAFAASRLRRDKPVARETRFGERQAFMSDGPHIRTPLPGPKAQAIIARDAAVVSPSYTRGYPLVIERGTGALVEDV